MPLRGGFGSVRVRTKSTDELVFLQVFSGGDYDLSKFAQGSRMSAEYDDILSNGLLPVIVDAGANVGAASIWFAAKYPRARILAVEPDAANAAMCRFNTSRLTQVDVIEAAVGSRPGRVSLTDPGTQTWAVQTIRSEAEDDVRVRTIPDLVRGAGQSARLFIVKIDIEGFEDDLFETNLDWVDEAAAIIVEPHDWMLPGRGTSRNLQRVLGERDFELLISGENLVYVRRGRRANTREAAAAQEARMSAPVEITSPTDAAMR